MLDETLLSQPAKACNTAIKACTLINDDVSPATVQDLMYSLDLIDGQYRPTDQVTNIELFTNQKFLEWLGEAALCRDAMNFNHEMMLKVQATWSVDEDSDGLTGKEAKEHCYQNIVDFGKRYEQAYLKMFNYLCNH